MNTQEPTKSPFQPIEPPKEFYSELEALTKKHGFEQWFFAFGQRMFQKEGVAAETDLINWKVGSNVASESMVRTITNHAAKLQAFLDEAKKNNGLK